MPNRCEHPHECKGCGEIYKCYKPECEQLPNGVCDVCMFKAHKVSQKMKKEV